MDEKPCKRCGEVKPLEDFHRQARGLGGRKSHCKECTRITEAEWYAKNADRKRSASLKYNKDNPHQVWVQAYRVRAKKYGFEPVIGDFTKQDVIDRYGDRCRCGGPFEELDHYPIPVCDGGPHTIDNVRPSCRRCNRLDPAEPGAFWSECDAETDKRRAKSRARGISGRLKKQGLPWRKIDYTLTRARIVEVWGDRCHRCGGPFEELDHYPVTIINGGTHTIDNVRPVCRRCNRPGNRATIISKEEVVANG